MGVLSSLLPPGHPEKVFTTGTCSFSASSMALSKSLSKLSATAGSGCTMLPWLLRALISRWYLSSVSVNFSRFPSSARSSAASQWALPGKPPQPISTICTPLSARNLHAWSKGRSPSATVNVPNFMISPPFPLCILPRNAISHFKLIIKKDSRIRKILSAVYTYDSAVYFFRISEGAQP